MQLAENIITVLGACEMTEGRDWVSVSSTVTPSDRGLQII